MENIEIKKVKEAADGWVFEVLVGEGDDMTRHKITVDKNYWQKLTKDEEDPQELVRRSFEFLLAREPKESILSEFNLKVINNYFPEYEQEIRKLLQN